MSKTIIIQEGGTGKTVTASKLKTAQSGGGNVLWVPEDEVQLTDISIREDGVFHAAAPYYGFDKVTVSGMNGGGQTDSDGDIVKPVTDPDTGQTTVQKVPTAIAITTKPTKLTYTDGDTIDFTGLVVKAMLRSNTVYTDSRYTTGVIPDSELIKSVTVASYNKPSIPIDWVSPYDNRTYSAQFAITVTKNGQSTTGQDLSGEGGTIPKLAQRYFYQNGTYRAASDGLDGYSTVVVNVGDSPTPTPSSGVDIHVDVVSKRNFLIEPIFTFVTTGGALDVSNAKIEIVSITAFLNRVNTALGTGAMTDSSYRQASITNFSKRLIETDATKLMYEYGGKFTTDDTEIYICIGGTPYIRIYDISYSADEEFLFTICMTLPH